MVYILFYPAEDNRAIEVTTSQHEARTHMGLVGLVLDVDERLYAAHGSSGASLLAERFAPHLWTPEAAREIDSCFAALKRLRDAMR